MRITNEELVKAVNNIAAMDCYSILENHVGRVRSIAETISTDTSTETADSLLLRLQLSLNNYFHFLSRVNPAQRELQEKLIAIKSAFASFSKVDEALNRIESELRNSIKRLALRISGFEGPSLLSWIHQVRYCLSRAIAKFDDLSEWAAALERAKGYREQANDYGGFLAVGWPELAFESSSLVQALESEVSTEWSFGKGRKVRLLSTRIESALSNQKQLAERVVGTQSRTDELLRVLSTDAEQVKTLLREQDELRESPTARIEYLFDEATEIFRQSRVEECIAQTDNKLASRLSNIQHVTGTNDWLQTLSTSHRALLSANELSQHVLPTFDSTSSLIDDLKNPEQRQELGSRRESLVRTLINADLTTDHQTTSSAEHVDWFMKRLTAPRARNRQEICARFSERILADDSSIQCDKDGSFTHHECLIDGTCPVCGLHLLGESSN